ncbi:LAQU0S11e02542g1_1 [Lachancea quebecensis]|uniref:LAQU0S11e02542g1_1 n=1 Tax=Lachancea quebecensis TaxID=1654605 RepID=A0A0P1L2N0_9SACH|nr:LAQU0S11e02542g1_1 [Lachancea quebecensis]
MANFLRDGGTGYKVRSNIFSKFRNKESIQDADFSAENDVTSFECSTMQDKHSGLDSAPSKDDTSVIATQNLTESTPKANRFPRNLKVCRPRNDEEELEITEVRQVSHRDLRKLLKNESTVNENLASLGTAEELKDTSTNDVLLDAFTNTQKICSNLKVELQRQKSENQEQAQAILSYKTELSAIEERIARYKQFLLVIEEKSQQLQSQKNDSEEQLRELRRSYGELQNRVREYGKECGTIKKSLEETRLMQKDFEVSVSKKAKEIEYLKKELNDSSGQLSEEKLKNRELLQELRALRKQSDSLAEKAIRKFESEVKKELSVINRMIKRDNQILTLSPEDKIELGSMLQNMLVVEIKNENKDLVSNVGQVFERGLSKVEEISRNAIESDSNLFAQQMTVLGELKDCVLSLSDKYQYLNDVSFNETIVQPISTLNQSMEKVQQSLILVAERLNQYKTQIDIESQYEKRVEDLYEKLQALSTQKTEAVALIRSKDLEIEELSNQVFTKNNTLSELATKEDKARNEVVEIRKVLQTKTKELKKLKEELNMLTANSESKLTSQAEIAKILLQERDSLKQDNGQLRASKKEVEEECVNVKDKANRAIEQVQALNVEVVQLKAQELELDEENRKLNIVLEQLHFDAKESSDQLREYKQQISFLENDKRNCASQTLECQDKINFLEQQLEDAQKEIREIRGSQQNIHFKRKPYSAVEGAQRLASPSAHLPNDGFDLSSSSNDDLEMTNPSPAPQKPFRAQIQAPFGKPLPSTKKGKKMLLSDNERSEHKSKNRKKRKT